MKRLNKFARAVQRDMDKIGDAIRAVLPEGACFALFVTDGEGEQAGMVANVDRDTILMLVHNWVETHIDGEIMSMGTPVDDLPERPN